VNSRFLRADLLLQIGYFVPHRGGQPGAFLFRGLHARLQLAVAHVQRNHQNRRCNREESVQNEEELGQRRHFVPSVRPESLSCYRCF
jgi:hypothetical protein